MENHLTLPTEERALALNRSSMTWPCSQPMPCCANIKGWLMDGILEG